MHNARYVAEVLIDGISIGSRALGESVVLKGISAGDPWVQPAPRPAAHPVGCPTRSRTAGALCEVLPTLREAFLDLVGGFGEVGRRQAEQERAVKDGGQLDC
jgi:hypothetical protein